MLNFAVYDNNPNMVNEISNMLESIFIENNLDAEVKLKTSKKNDLLDFMNKSQIDVLCLDIVLNSRTTLEVLNKLRANNKDFYLIFITAHTEFVFLAYKFKTFDFIHKPINKSILQETILRLFNDISENNSHKYLKLNNKNTIIATDEIFYINRDGTKLVIHTNTNDYKIYNSLDNIQNELPCNFIRCHKSFIANIDKVVKIEPSSNLIYFKNNSTCDIGAKYKNNFMKGINFYVKNCKY